MAQATGFRGAFSTRCNLVEDCRHKLLLSCTQDRITLPTEVRKNNTRKKYGLIKEMIWRSCRFRDLGLLPGETHLRRAERTTTATATLADGRHSHHQE